MYVSSMAPHDLSDAIQEAAPQIDDAFFLPALEGSMHLQNQLFFAHAQLLASLSLFARSRRIGVRLGRHVQSHAQKTEKTLAFRKLRYEQNYVQRTKNNEICVTFWLTRTVYAV